MDDTFVTIDPNFDKKAPKIVFDKPVQVVYFHFEKCGQEYMGVIEQSAVDKDYWTVILDGVDLKICSSLDRAKKFVLKYVIDNIL